jgi:hypothetical protein
MDVGGVVGVEIMMKLDGVGGVQAWASVTGVDIVEAVQLAGVYANGLVVLIAGIPPENINAKASSRVPSPQIVTKFVFLMDYAHYRRYCSERSG